MAWDIGADQYVEESYDTTLVVQDIGHAHGIANVQLAGFQPGEDEFGNEALGLNSSAFAGSVVGSKFTLPVRGQVVSLTACVGRNALWDVGADQYAEPANRSVQYALYDAAGNLLGATASGTLGTLAWLTLDLVAPVEIDAGDYILCANSDDPSGFIRYEAPGGVGFIAAQAFGTWPETLSFTADGEKNYSIYGTYHPASSDTVLVVADIAHGHAIEAPVLSPLGSELIGKNYLEEGSLQITLGGAGMSPDPIAGQWNAKISSPGGIFNHFHPTSAYKDFFRVGRPVRISLGGNYNGVDHWWTRMMGYMDAPRYNRETHSLTIGGGDMMKRLADLELRRPGNYWGEAATFSMIATAATYNQEMYAEADALDPDPDAEANNMTNWVDGGGINVSTIADTGAGSAYVGVFSKPAGYTYGYSYNINVGSVTQGKEYEFSFDWAKSGGTAGTLTVRLYSYADGDGAQIIEVSGLTGVYLDYDKCVLHGKATKTGTAGMLVRVDGLASEQEGFRLDNVSIREVTSKANAGYPLLIGANGPYLATLDGGAYWFGDDNQGWYYDEANRVFHPSDDAWIVAGTDNLVVRYFISQAVEDVVADILVQAGLYATRAAAKTAMDYTATGVTIPRVWFDAGTKAIEALRLCCERVNYRFWLGYDGTPRFKLAPTAGASVFDFTALSDVRAPEEYQDLAEIRNRIIIDGAERGMYQVREDKEKSRWTGEASDPTSIDPITGYGERTQTIKNHLFQDQASIDAMCATLLAERKDPKWYSDPTVPYNPVPLEKGDTITWPVANGAVTTIMTGIIREINLGDNVATYKCEIVESA